VAVDGGLSGRPAGRLVGSTGDKTGRESGRDMGTAGFEGGSGGATGLELNGLMGFVGTVNTGFAASPIGLPPVLASGRAVASGLGTWVGLTFITVFTARFNID
jgi:hypothetical protein